MRLLLGLSTGRPCAEAVTQQAMHGHATAMYHLHINSACYVRKRITCCQRSHRAAERVTTGWQQAQEGLKRFSGGPLAVWAPKGMSGWTSALASLSPTVD